MLTKEGLINFLRDIKCEHSIQNSYGATLYKYYAPIINEDLLESLADFLIQSDFEKVTRCKDCKFNGTQQCVSYEENPEGKDWQILKGNDFCSWGRKKGE